MRLETKQRAVVRDGVGPELDVMCCYAGEELEEHKCTGQREVYACHCWPRQFQIRHGRRKTYDSTKMLAVGTRSASRGTKQR